MYMHVKFGSFVKKLSSSKKGHDQGCMKMDSSDKKKKETPEGFVPVYVGEDRTRYEVPVECLNSFRFQAFLDQHEEEILGSRDEPISLLCSPNVFETILTLAKDDTKLLRLLERS